MDRRRNRIALGAAALLVVIAAQHPTADLRLITHDVGDAMPHRFQAVANLGLMTISLLVTWSGRAMAR